MNLKEKIENDLHDAMRSNNDLSKNTIRMLLSSIKLIEIEKHTALEDQEILSVIQKEIKMRNETIAEVNASGRADLLEKAQQEIEFLKRYLPAQLSDEDIQIIVRSVIAEIGASNIKDMGVVMKNVLPKIGGRASTERVSNSVKNYLSQL
jgi:uncharacterized protein